VRRGLGTDLGDWAGGRVKAIAGRDIDQQIEDVVKNLTREFGPRVGEDRVRDEVMTTYRDLSHAKIQTFVPLLTQRYARDHLRRTA